MHSSVRRLLYFWIFGGYKVRWGAWSQKSQARMSVSDGE